MVFGCLWPGAAALCVGSPPAERMNPTLHRILLAVPFLVVAVCLLSAGARRPAPAFRFAVSGYTNVLESRQALLYITNASSTPYEFFPETEIPTNNRWELSAAQPKDEVIPEVFPARSARTILVPVTPESIRWRLQCRIWYVRSPLYWRAYHLLQDWRLAPGFEPGRAEHLVTSPEFVR